MNVDKVEGDVASCTEHERHREKCNPTINYRMQLARVVLDEVPVDDENQTSRSCSAS